MTRTQVLYLLPYFASLGLCVGVLTYASKHRRAKGVAAYTLYVEGQTLWILGFIFEMVGPGVPGKIFWDGFQWLAVCIAIQLTDGCHHLVYQDTTLILRI